MNTNNYRDKFKDISIFYDELGSGFQSTVDLNKLINVPRIQPTDKNLVAIKNYKPDQFDDLDAGAIKELNILYRVMGCPHLIQLLDVDILIINQKMILRMMIPYHTNDLTHFIKEISFDEKLKYVRVIIDQLLNALLQLSIKGIIHRDIKPDNILIDYEYDIDTNILLKERLDLEAIGL